MRMSVLFSRESVLSGEQIIKYSRRCAMRIVVLLLALAGLARLQAEPLIYTRVWAADPPEIRDRRAFLPLRAVCDKLDAGVQWDRDQGTVCIRHAGMPEIVLTLGSTSATVGGKAVILPDAPYVRGDRTMVPARFLTERFGVPFTYHAATRTVRFSVGNRLYVLPLVSYRGDIIFESPAPGSTVGSPILLQGVANVWEGDFPVELHVNGKRIAECVVTSGVAGLYPFSERLNYRNTSGKILDAVVVAYEPDGRDNVELKKHTLKVRLLPTGSEIRE